MPTAKGSQNAENDPNATLFRACIDYCVRLYPIVSLDIAIRGVCWRPQVDETQLRDYVGHHRAPS